MPKLPFSAYVHFPPCNDVIEAVNQRTHAQPVASGIQLFPKRRRQFAEDRFSSRCVSLCFVSLTALCAFSLTMKNFEMWCLSFVLCLQVFSAVSGLTVMEKIREDPDLSEVRFCFDNLQRAS